MPDIRDYSCPCSRNQSCHMQCTCVCHTEPTHCHHTNGIGLCPACQADYDEDPTAWEEYGHHERGERNAQDLLSEMRRDAEATPVQPYGEDVPL